jgi:putative DNA methylase
MKDKPRLIEVAFPLKQASVASVHEKSVRHGHISTLHTWPARRPLAASRAALLATLLPDPGDPQRRKELLAQIGGEIVTKPVEETDDDGNTVVEDKELVEGGVLGWGQENAPVLVVLQDTIREFYGGRAPRVIDPFAGGGAIPFEAMRLGCEVTASDLNPVAWLILKCTLDYPQELTGKKRPLPNFVRNWPDFIEDFLTGKVKKRRGSKKRHFSDPAQLALMALPDADLAWQVRAWGHWVLERVRADLASRYPVVNGEPTVAYLWARTARDKPTSRQIPLLKTFWLCKKAGRRVALLPIPNSEKAEVSFRVLQESDLRDPERLISEHPFLKNWEVNANTFADFLKSGTMNRAGVWSPLSGRPGMIALTMDDLRRQGQQGLLGTQMTAVIVEAKRPNGKTTYKRYRLPTEKELQAAVVEIEDIETAFADIPFGIPAEPLPPIGTLGFRIPLYGFKKWRELFTNRQLLALSSFIRHTRSAVSLNVKDCPEAAQAIGAYLAICIDRLADYSSAVCSWHNGREIVRNTFGRFALPMVWDFCEVNPLSDSSGNFLGAIEWVSMFISHALQTCAHAERPAVRMESALTKSLSPTDLVLTDPPYYDAIPYSDLMDFFYVWLRRTLYGLSAEIDLAFQSEVSPKWNHDKNDGELIDDQSRFGGDKEKSKKNYEDGMASAFRTKCESLTESGRMVIVFANKEVAAWETLISAVIRGGAVVTASWPIQTEMPNRTRGMSSAALSSSVWIVCRKRQMAAPTGWEENVLDRMKQILFDPREALGGRNVLQYYFDLGIRGPDFIWAALGPALEAYSAHPFVKKTAGGIMTVPEFLREVRRLVLQFSLGELPGFREIQSETQGRGETLELDPVTQYYLLHRAYFGLEPAPVGPCILYANACGKNETELKVVWNILEQRGKRKQGRPRQDEDEDEVNDVSEDAADGKGNECRLLSWQERTSEVTLGESRVGQPAPLIDKLHRLMYLLQQNRIADVQQTFDTWSLSNERSFKPLLQAVRELALRDKQDSERRLVEALATQLHMNRKTIVVANEMKEVSLFDSIEDAGQIQVNRGTEGKDSPHEQAISN